jgi:predicted dehydrogenase
MWDNLRIGIIGQGSQYKRISKILRSLGISFKIYKPSSDSNYYNKEEFNKLKSCNAIFILSPNNTHLKYIELLKDNRYLFCEKPPVNKINDLNKLKKIRSNKLYFNYNFRFSKISELLRETNKLNLNDLLYASIITGHGLGFKKEYPDSWRSNRKICKKGVFEIVSIHWVDLINYHFGIKKIEKINLRNYMKNSNGVDNSYCKIHLINKSEIDIFSSYTSPLYQRMIFIFSNGIIEQNADSIEVRGPAMNLDKHDFFKKPSLIKKIKLNTDKDYLLSLEKSVLYFLKHASKSKSFPKDDLKKSLISNSYVI